MKDSWDNYHVHAWGTNELKPISQRGHTGSVFGSAKLGATIVDAVDTLYIMGMEKEYQQGRDWIANYLDFDNMVSKVIYRIPIPMHVLHSAPSKNKESYLFNYFVILIYSVRLEVKSHVLSVKHSCVSFQRVEVSVFETNIRFVGGLLTMYALTGDSMYKDKAYNLAKKLLPAFETPTGIPYALITLNAGVLILFVYSLFCL